MEREPSRVFVGKLGIASGGVVRRLESLSVAVPVALDNALLAELAELLPLPRAETVDAPLATDLAFDVDLHSRTGSATDVSLGTAGLPLYWRPSVRLAARLYHLRSMQPEATFYVTERMPWSRYLGRVLSWRVLAGLEPPARRSDLEQLLRQAAEKLLTRVQGAAD